MAEYDRSQLTISWRDSAWIPFLNPSNVLEYFSQETNPFYDRKCNNEMIKMQNLDPNQMTTMTGVEYALLHEQAPALYVIRKQHRHSINQVTPLADYYILMGTVYQAPDLCAIINSRLTTALCRLQSAFDETLAKTSRRSAADPEAGRKETADAAAAARLRASTFQRRRVDMLLGKLKDAFPPRVVEGGSGGKPVSVGQSKQVSGGNEKTNGIKEKDGRFSSAKKRKLDADMWPSNK
ncbi:mediator of RNA polymerase II transcription subunit 6-like [Oscarella lobularis]|uniref:mediator of RNA polymerase II transcription subunit 6-like n=1 Tax=Oscarella lobularis TaxID=121494 RepID=UPI00331363B5